MSRGADLSIKRPELPSWLTAVQLATGTVGLMMPDHIVLAVTKIKRVHRTEEGVWLTCQLAPPSEVERLAGLKASTKRRFAYVGSCFTQRDTCAVNVAHVRFVVPLDERTEPDVPPWENDEQDKLVRD